MKRKDERHYRVELFDGRGTATVCVVDGYGRVVDNSPANIVYVEGVHTEREAITAALDKKPELCIR
jgi:hypothetical protein